MISSVILSAEKAIGGWVCRKCRARRYMLLKLQHALSDHSTHKQWRSRRDTQQHGYREREYLSGVLRENWRRPGGRAWQRTCHVEVCYGTLVLKTEPTTTTGWTPRTPCHSRSRHERCTISRRKKGIRDAQLACTALPPTRSPAHTTVPDRTFLVATRV